LLVFSVKFSVFSWALPRRVWIFGRWLVIGWVFF